VRIMVVDDSPTFRAGVAKMLAQMGHEPVPAENGLQALERAREEFPDLVLMDARMPVMDGYEFVEAQAKDPTLTGLKIALVTTEGNKERLERMAQLGVTGYLRKPFAPEELRALVAQWFQEA